MPWYAWLMVANLVAGGLINIMKVGQTRGPVTGGTAALGVVMVVLYTWGIVELAGWAA